MVELRCIAEGQPPPEISWFFLSDELEDSAHYRLPKNGSLLVLDMTSSLAGQYVCRAKNLVTTSNATVELKYAGEYIHMCNYTDLE